MANRNSDDVSAFAFDAREGKLEEVAGSPFSSGDGTSKLTLHPTKPFLYAFNAGARTLRAFSIDAATGVLTDRGSLNMNSPDTKLSIDPSGRFAYVVANFAAQTLRTYAIDPVTGALSLADAINIPTRVAGMAFDSEGRRLYVFNSGSNLIHCYALDATTGVPTPMTGSPITSGSGQLELLAVHPNGRFLYASSPVGLNLHAGVTVFEISRQGR